MLDRPRRRARGAVALALVLFYAALAVWLTWPQATHLSTLTASHHDSLFSMWRLAWIAHALRDPGAHLFDGNIFVPNPRTLAYSDAILLPGVVLAPLTWAGVPIAVTYNLLIVASFVLSALAAAYLCWRVTGRLEAALVGGLVYGFAPLRFEHFNHLELQLNWWLPLLLVAIEAAVVRGAWRAWLAVSLLATAQLLCCIYHTMLFAVYGAAFAAMTAWPLARQPRRWLGAAWLAIPAAALVVYSAPYRANHSRLGDRPWDEVMSYSASWIDFVRAAPTSVTWGERLAGGHNERFLFIGAIAIGLAAIAIGTAAVTGARRRTVATHAVLALVAIDLARGGNGWLFPFLVAHAPGFTGLRVPARAGILLLLSGSVLAAVGVDAIVSRLSRRTAMVAAALLAVAVGWEYRERPDFRVVDPIPQIYQWVRATDDRPVLLLELPVTTADRLDIIPDPLYMYNSTRHWLPLANGYSGFYPPDYLHMLSNLRDFPGHYALTTIARRHVTHLVLHERGWRGRVSYGEAVEQLIGLGWPPLALLGPHGDSVVLFAVPRE